MLEAMTLDDFNIPLYAKIDGTRFLDEAFTAHCPDFYVMLSSASGILGNSGQANYAAGSTFQDTYANRRVDSHTHYTSIDLGPIKDAGSVSQSPELEDLLVQRGFISIEVARLLPLIEYSMSRQAKDDKCHQIVVGFNKRSLTESNHTFSLKNPMLRHLQRTHLDHLPELKQEDAENFEVLIAQCQNIEEAQSTILEVLTKKFGTLVLIDSQSMDPHAPLADYGFDSLVGIELKNWIGRTMHSSLQTSEIIDMPSLTALAERVAERSSLTKYFCLHHSTSNTISEGQQAEKLEHLGHVTTPTLPKQPLPDLDETLNDFLVVTRPISSDEEHRRIEAAVQEFRESGGLGRQLQQRLVHRSLDPGIESWLADSIGPNNFLVLRRPLIPFGNFFGSHHLSRKPHYPAERAAVISVAAFQFKQRLKNNELAPKIINEQIVDLHQQQWLFNACRIPGINIDEVRKFEDNDYIVTIRRGHFFKVALSENNEEVPFEKLRATFQAILDATSKETSWLGILTADERIPWTKVWCTAHLS